MCWKAPPQTATPDRLVGTGSTDADGEGNVLENSNTNSAPLT
jgi:hypothetical protein